MKGGGCSQGKEQSSEATNVWGTGDEKRVDNVGDFGLQFEVVVPQPLNLLALNASAH